MPPVVCSSMPVWTRQLEEVTGQGVTGQGGHRSGGSQVKGVTGQGVKGHRSGVKGSPAILDHNILGNVMCSEILLSEGVHNLTPF